ncbi:hypothetical protein KBY74_08310, partial [Cyanobium sp. A1C-AMD]|uniref:calcium-binding protein n=1 Tax=Cyanobium sp. A1C-AMD TaxID=2823694 RepID=UPI0028F4398B
MAISSAATNLLGPLLPEWHLLLQSWSASGRLTAAAREALLLSGEPKALTDLTDQWAAGEFGGLPPIVLLSAADINAALGAYAISTGTIYLNADWLAGATKEQVLAVLTEELGHHLDGLLNAVDTPGDEGEYFAALLTKPGVLAGDLQALRLQKDAGNVVAQGQRLAAEYAIDLTPPRAGGNDPETLTGTSGDDLIDGFGGDDNISGLAGNDVLIGGEGNDTIDGGTGINRISGDAGDDTITSSGIGDVVNAGEGNNTIVITGIAVGGTYTSGTGTDAYTIQTGATGTFSIISGAGNDNLTIQSGVNADITINAGDGLNTINSLSGIIRFDSGSSDDIVNLTSALTYVITGAGNDSISASGQIGSYGWLGKGHGISAGDGNDTILLTGGSYIGGFGGAEGDWTKIRGDSGDDTITLSGNANYDAVYGGNDNDVINASTANNVRNIFGDAGNDTITGTSSNDNISGGAGNDLVAAGNGNNNAYGDDGDDTITAGFGNDNLYGGNGIDSITSGDGDDNLYGEAGNDSLNGGSGFDTLQGGSGNDTLHAGAGNDVIYGGKATAANTDPNEIDTFVLTGNASNYTISRATDSIFGYVYYIKDNRVGSPDGLDTLYDIDQLQFADGTQSVASYYASKAAGGAGSETLTGTSGDDLIDGFGGDDNISGLA